MTFQFLLFSPPNRPKPGLEEAAHVHLLDEMNDFIVVHDGDTMVATFFLVAVDLAGEGGDKLT